MGVCVSFPSLSVLAGDFLRQRRRKQFGSPWLGLTEAVVDDKDVILKLLHIPKANVKQDFC